MNAVFHYTILVFSLSGGFPLYFTGLRPLWLRYTILVCCLWWFPIVYTGLLPLVVSHCTILACCLWWFITILYWSVASLVVSHFTILVCYLSSGFPLYYTGTFQFGMLWIGIP